MNQTIVAALIGAAATIIGAYIVTKNTRPTPAGVVDPDPTMRGGKSAGPTVETEGAGPAPPNSEAKAQARLRPGESVCPEPAAAFLNAIDAAGGAVSRSEFHALGRKFGFDPRGLGGFFTGKEPSIRTEGDRRVLTERGEAQAALWRERHGNGKQ